MREKSREQCGASDNTRPNFRGFACRHTGSALAICGQRVTARRAACRVRNSAKISSPPALILDHNGFAEPLPLYPLPFVGELTAEVSSTSATASCTLFCSQGSANAENATIFFHFGRQESSCMPGPARRERFPALRKRASATPPPGALASPARDALGLVRRGAAVWPGRPGQAEHGRSCKNEGGLGLRRHQVSPEGRGCSVLHHRGHCGGDSEARVPNPGGCIARRPQLLCDQRPQLQLRRRPGIVVTRGTTMRAFSSCWTGIESTTTFSTERTWARNFRSISI